MRSSIAPASLLPFISTILLAPSLTSAFPPLEPGVPYSQLFERSDCGGQVCGWNGQLCCESGQGCFTNTLNQAICTPAGSAATTAAGEWNYITTTYVETDLQTITSTISSYVGGGGWAQPTSGACDYASNETPCGDTCCASNEYCYTQGHCKLAANGDSSAYYTSYYSTMYETTNSAGVPLRPTSSTLIVVTETESPTTTVAFETPVATGAEVGLTESEEGGGGGLSGGAIAGIVIGTLLGLALLGLLCFYCCIRGLFAAFLGLFGIGKKKQRRTEVDEYERYSHHGSGRHSGAGAGAGRTWYGAAARPSRPERRDDSKSKKLLGVGAGLAGLWAILGLKRRHDRRHDDEKYSEYSYSSDYYTNTSASEYPSRIFLSKDHELTTSPIGSASSDDRRTRDTRDTRRSRR